MDSSDPLSEGPGVLAIVGLAWCWNPRSERRSELAGPDVASAMRAASREILEVLIAVVCWYGHPLRPRSNHSSRDMRLFRVSGPESGGIGRMTTSV